MSKQYRPRLHFSPPAHWINDPNGLVHDGVKWHAFAQYNPNYPKIEEKHWWHMTSEDLVVWEQIGDALEPDELGQIYSGSAVYDENNTSGFGKDGKPPIVAMFTHHGAYEQQSIAYSTDGIHFTKYQGNPVIPNKSQPDFRDPKVFYNRMKGCWSMVLAAGDHAEFYTSPDLIEWTKTGAFYSDTPLIEHLWECPDMIEVQSGDGVQKWILIVSIGATPELRGSRTIYFIGSFDGDTFIQDPDTPAQWLDFGHDNYASVSFSKNDGQAPVMIGWHMNWAYCSLPPADPYAGILTLPRELYLRRIDGKAVLCQKPVKAIDTYLSKGKKIAGEGAVLADTFKISVKSDVDFEVCLSNKYGESLKIGLKNHKWYCDRGGCSRFLDSHVNAHVYKKSEAERLCGGAAEAEIYFDVCSCEVYADNGSIAMANLVYLQERFDTVSVTEGACAMLYECK